MYWVAPIYIGKIRESGTRWLTAFVEQHVVLNFMFGDFRSDFFSKAMLHIPSFMNSSKDNQLTILFCNQKMSRNRF